MRFTDISNDCLETIVGYLDLVNLLNIADVNKCLRNVATSMYFRRHRHKKVILIEARHSQYRSLQVQNDFVQIEDLKTSLQTIRCFGGLIPEIVFYSRGDAYRFGKRVYPDLTHHILSYVNEYCSESLTSITFQERLENVSTHLKKPFKRVEKVVIKHCELPENTDLVKLFPSMRELNCVGLVNASCLVHHFPNLEHLSVEIWQRRESIKSKCEMTTVLSLNPQLKTLRISSPGIQRFLNPPLVAAVVLDGARERLQNLQSFTMHGTYFSGSNFDGNVIHLKNVSYFHIHLQGLLDEPLPMIPFSFEKLESFRLELIVNLGVEFDKFVKNHPTIKKLTILFASPKNGQFQPKLADVMPSLVDIEIWSGRFSIDEILRFLTDFKALKRINVNFIEQIDFDELKARINGDWRASIVDHYRFQRIFLERKFDISPSLE